MPAVYGHEAAGIVIEIGDGVEKVKIGDRVIVTLLRHCGKCFFCRSDEPALCDADFPINERSPLQTHSGEKLLQGLRTGAFAEEVVVDVSQLAGIPDEMPLDSASLMACGVITGAGAVVNTAGLSQGSSAVVIGCGGVGLNCLQGAVISGAMPLIGIDLHPEKVETARLFGATHVFNATSLQLPERIKELTYGRGADYVFVSVGSITAIEQGLKLLRRGGTLVLAGMTGLGEKLSLEAIDIGDSSLRIIGSKMGSTDLQRDIPKWIAYYQQGCLKLDELISGRYPIESINDAIALVRKGSVLRNVIVFDGTENHVEN